jgi:hypothetical protein
MNELLTTEWITHSYHFGHMHYIVTYNMTYHTMDMVLY